MKGNFYDDGWSGSAVKNSAVKEGVAMRQGTQETVKALRVAADAAMSYVEGARERRVAPAAGDVAGLARFHEEFPAEGTGAAEVIELLSRVGAPGTVATLGGGFLDL